MSAQIPIATMTTLLIATSDVSGTLIDNTQFIIEDKKAITLNEESSSSTATPIIQMFQPVQSYTVNLNNDDYETDTVFEKLKRELISYTQLKSDWDYNGGVVPQQSSVNTSLIFLEKLKTFALPLPKTMLSGDGEVCLYWAKQDFYIEVGFEEEGLYSYIVDNHSTPFSEDDCSIDDFIKSKLFNALNKFS